MSSVIDIMTEGIEEPCYINNVASYLRTLVDEVGETNWEMSLTLCSNEYIAELNSEYRHKEGPTDVLTFVLDEGDDSFPLGDDTLHPVGDMVVSLEKVKENSLKFNVSYNEELKRVILHGVLHLKGLTHEGYDWDEGMLKEQEKILKKYRDIRFTEEDETILD